MTSLSAGISNCSKISFFLYCLLLQLQTWFQLFFSVLLITTIHLNAADRTHRKLIFKLAELDNFSIQKDFFESMPESVFIDLRLRPV